MTGQGGTGGDAVADVRTAFDCPWLTVREAVVRQGAALTSWYYVDHPGCALVLPVTADGRVALIRTWRVAVRQWCWEAPAGRIEPAELPGDTARRELREEIGGECEKLLRLGQVFASSGSSSAGLSRTSARRRSRHCWPAVTLTEHKAKHDADHVAVVAPNPSGSRMFARATQHNVVVISADQLVGLCRQHAKTPLGLDDYRSLFATGGSLDMQAVDERAEDVKRLVTLAAAICEAIRDRSTVFGRLSARDLFLILSAQTVAEGTTEDELQALLDTLASPLLAVLQGSKNDGYRVTTSAKVAQRRIEMVAQQLSASQP